MTFEDAMERLEEIVSAMEGDRLPLEEMVQSYEEGAGLLKVCRSRIETARQRVELITTKMDAPSEVSLTPFSAADAAVEATPRETAVRTPARRSTSARPTPPAEDAEIRLF
jgi:exodeoxyribonuclease VII small subunit